MTATHAVPPLSGRLVGLWRRSLIAFPDGRRDTTSQVLWLQGCRAFADIRRPAPMADFSHIRALVDLSMEDCLQLSSQQGFAGGLTYDGEYFEWNRSIDFQPRGLHADAGSLRWENSVLIEKGRDVDYVEHWHLESGAQEPVASVTLRDTARNIDALLLRVGNHFAFARDRAIALSPHTTLRACVAAAASVEQARGLVDCEISFGKGIAGEVRIYSSTLPHRVGQRLEIGHDAGWEIIASEGDAREVRALLSSGGSSASALCRNI